MIKVIFKITAIKNADGTMSVNGRPTQPEHTGRFSIEIPEEETEAQKAFEGSVDKEFYIAIEEVNPIEEKIIDEDIAGPIAPVVDETKGELIEDPELKKEEEISFTIDDQKKEEVFKDEEISLVVGDAPNEREIVEGNSNGPTHESHEGDAGV